MLLKRLSPVLCVVALASHAAQAQTHRIEVRCKVGEVFKYRLSSVIEAVGEKGDIKLNVLMTEKLIGLKNGVFSWDTRLANVQVAATGVMKGAEETLEELAGFNMISHQDLTGKVLKLVAAGTEIQSEGSANPVFPKGPVKVGHTWVAPIEVSGHVFKIRYRFAGVETAAKKKTFRIEGELVPGSGAKSLKKTIFIIEAANGKLLSGESVAEVKSNGNVLRVSYKIIRA